MRFLIEKLEVILGAALHSRRIINKSGSSCKLPKMSEGIWDRGEDDEEERCSLGAVRRIAYYGADCWQSLEYWGSGLFDGAALHSYGHAGWGSETPIRCD